MTYVLKSEVSLPEETLPKLFLDVKPQARQCHLPILLTSDFKVLIERGSVIVTIHLSAPNLGSTHMEVSGIKKGGGPDGYP